MEINLKSHGFSVQAFPFNEESEIYDKYPNAFEALKKKESEWPIHPCVSCFKLCSTVQLQHIPLNLEDDSEPFVELLNYYGHYEDEAYVYGQGMCTYCLTKFKNKVRPPTCVLNDLEFEPVPDCISSLNEFEKLFIQRAKAFQVVARMDSVMGGHNKQRPNSEVIKKIKERVFHLPLPLENSLSRPPNPSEAILKDQELTVIIRGIPNDKKHVWQSLIDVTKIYKALKWLKQNNPLYADIVLPHNAESLLDGVTVHVEEMPDAFDDIPSMEVENNDESDVEMHVQNEKKMITQKALVIIFMKI